MLGESSKLSRATFYVFKERKHAVLETLNIRSEYSDVIINLDYHGRGA
jgi:hypothetical protein